MLSRKKNHFMLFNPEKKFTYKNHETLELSCASQEEMESWMASFLRAGMRILGSVFFIVYPSSSSYSHLPSSIFFLPSSLSSSH